MSATKVRAALEAAVSSMSPSLETAWENKAFTPPAASVAYQKVAVLFARPENTENNASYDERGFMQITLYYPENKGPGDAAARAEVIRAAFPRGRTLTSGGVTTTIMETPEIAPGSNVGDRWIVPVRIRFLAQIQV